MATKTREQANIEAQDTAAQCRAFKEGIANFRVYLSDFPFKDMAGERAVPVADVVRWLDCIENDAVEAVADEQGVPA